MPKRQLVQIEHDIQTRKRPSCHFALDREILINQTGGSIVTETKHYRPKAPSETSIPVEEIRCEESHLPLSDPPKISHKEFSELLRDLDSQIPTLIDCLVQSQAPPASGSVCNTCSKHELLFSCLDCPPSIHECQHCTLNYHRRHPYHRINQYVVEVNSGHSYMTRTTLDELGFMYCLGHSGTQCPHSFLHDIKKYTIIHDNGIHSLKIVPCSCPDAPNLLSQLAAARFIPATTERPQTLFTHDVLTSFYHHTHESGATAYAFHEALRCITDDVHHNSVPDRYREFLRVTRIWRRIQDLLRSGQWLNINDLLPDRAQNTVAVLCPACPQPAINLSADYHLAPNPYIHKFFAAIDGNFRQVLTKKRHDSNDYSLSERQSYFVPDDSYSEYLSKVTDTRELSTCTGFKAGDILRQTRDKNLAVTGIVAISCSRHNMMYSNVDFAVASALTPFLPTSIPIELDYDIACKYHINFEKRIELNFSHLVPLFDRLSYAVPGMHIKAHDENCQKRFTRDYLPGTGKCDAEGSERIWSELNQWASSVSEMNPGHRHDILNDNINDWNWRKLLSLARYLVDRLLLARKSKAQFVTQLEELSATTSSSLIADWQLLSTQPQVLPNGKVKSVYFNDIDKVPTFAGVRRSVEQQDINVSSGQNGLNLKTELVDALRITLEIEQMQHDILQYIKTHPIATLSADQKTTLANMRRSICTHMKDSQCYWTPGYSSCQPMQSPDEPENIVLNLPSSFEPDERQDLGCVSAAALERKLREVFAYKAINDLKCEIMSKLASLTARQIHVSGQRQTTRAAQVINQHAEKMEYYGSIYTRHRRAMLILGMKSNDPVFKELKRGDCSLTKYRLDVLAGQYSSKVPKSQHTVSWIWRMGSKATTVDDTEWFSEVQKTQWFLCRAQKERWAEEVEIVEEEMCRVLRFFRFFYHFWLSVAERFTDNYSTRPYAIRMAMTYHGLFEDAIARFDPKVVKSVV